MIFKPQKYSIADRSGVPFIDSDEINSLIRDTISDKKQVLEIIEKSLDKNRLTLQEVAQLINATDTDQIELIKEGARQLKEKVYGNRIVLFAPLYVGNMCTNDCQYCGFRTSNKNALRTTLSDSQLIQEVKALEDTGQKRLILVFGEHPKYNAQYIADVTRKVYSIKKGNGEIRRVNINAAPLSIDGFRTVLESKIGTYQVFQETYHPDIYKTVHPSGKKSDYDWRLTALDRAQEAGIDDVGIGALFGLYDWRFEVMGLVRHVNHFEAVYHVGPHTISFPRIQYASMFNIDKSHLVKNEEFVRLVAILRLAVPYTGMILTAREPEHIRNDVIRFGVSQIDGGTNIELGGYSENKHDQNINREQFTINDNRSLNEVIDELVVNGFIPSFCTSCYRLGRTGEHFMEFSVPGFIKRFCDPNGILTLAEYLEDYAPAETKEKGYKLINDKLLTLAKDMDIEPIEKKIGLIKQGKRDLYF